MKITIITGPFSCLPPHSIGAIEKLWYSIGEGLIKEGIEIIYISKKPEAFEPKDNHIYIEGYERTGSWLRDFLKDLIYSWRALKQLPQSDIVILNSLWSPILIRFFKNKYKISIFSVERFPKRQLTVYNSIGKIDYFRCCSSAVYKELLNQSAQLKDKSWIIPNFIDTRVFNCNKPRKLSVEPTVVYAGRVHREKGIDILVEAVEYLYQEYGLKINLMIIGASDIERGGSGQEYVNALRERGANVNITWIDAIYNPKELAEKIKGGDIFCYPSVANKGETFGVAPLEAMALGLPVIVSNLECFKDFVIPSKNALVFNQNDKNAIEKLAYNIKKLIDLPELFNKLSLEGAKTARKFSVEEISKVYYKKFEELLNVKNIY